MLGVACGVLLWAGMNAAALPRPALPPLPPFFFPPLPAAAQEEDDQEDEPGRQGPGPGNPQESFKTLWAAARSISFAAPHVHTSPRVGPLCTRGSANESKEIAKPRNHPLCFVILQAKASVAGEAGKGKGKGKIKLGLASAFFSPSSVSADFGLTLAKLDRNLFDVTLLDVMDGNREYSPCVKKSGP